MLNKRLEKLVKDNKYSIDVVSRVPNDIATVKIKYKNKTVYVYLVYIRSEYRLYSMSLDIIPSSIYDDLPNHDEKMLSVREGSIIKNIQMYLNMNFTIHKARYLIFQYDYVALDIDGLTSKLKISRAAKQGRTLKTKDDLKHLR